MHTSTIARFALALSLLPLAACGSHETSAPTKKTPATGQTTRLGSPPPGPVRTALPTLTGNGAPVPGPGVAMQKPVALTTAQLAENAAKAAAANAAAAAANERPSRGTWLAVVYGGNRQGEVEPCG